MGSAEIRLLTIEDEFTAVSSVISQDQR